MTQRQANGTWQMVLAMALSGTIGLAVVESGMSPLSVVFYRCLIGGAGLLAWLALTRSWSRIGRRDLLWIVAGGLALVMNWLSLFSSYRYGSISVSTVVYHTQPFMLLCLAAVVQREPMDPGRLPWLVLAFVGVVLTSQVHSAEGSTWLGALLASLAALLYAVATLVTRRLKHLPPSQIAALQMGVGVLVLLPIVWQDLGPLDKRGMTAVLTLGLVHTAFMYTIMYAAFQRLPTQSIAVLSFIYPLVALLVDLFYFDVALHWAQQLGMAAIVLALLANQRQWNVASWLRWRATRT